MLENVFDELVSSLTPYVCGAGHAAGCVTFTFVGGLSHFAQAATAVFASGGVRLAATQADALFCACHGTL